MSFQYRQVQSDAQYTTNGLHSNANVSFFYNPSVVSNNIVLPHRVGQRPAKGLKPSSFVYSFAFADEDVFPIGSGSNWWKQTWNDSGDGLKLYHSVWEVRSEQIPDEFVCVSPFFFKVEEGGYTPPNANEVQGLVAVSASLVNFSRGPNLEFVWQDAGDRAKEYVSIYTTTNRIGHFAFPTFNPSISNAYFPVLDLSKGNPVQ